MPRDREVDLPGAAPELTCVQKPLKVSIYFAEYTISPPTTVYLTFALKSSDCGIAKRSPSMIVRSASFPGSIVPREFSSNAA